MDKIAIWIIASVGGILILFFLKIFISKMKKERETHLKAADKQREEELERILLNGRIGSQHKLKANPIEVQYQENKSSCLNNQVVHITENNELSKKRYILNPSNKIFIGSKAGENDIVVQDPNLSGCKCKIFRVENDICINNMEPCFKAFLKRGQKMMDIGLNTVILNSGDILILGSVSFKIDFVKIKGEK